MSDVDGADGTKQYKLDLTLPRPPVVTTSESEPTGGCDGDFWVDESEAGAGGGTTRSVVAVNAPGNEFSIVYSVGRIDVFLNGLLLTSGTDYTATNGTSVTLSEAVDVGDTLQFWVWW